MSRPLIAALAAAAALALPANASAQAPQVRIGILSCYVAAGTGFVFGSSKQLDCTLEGEGRRERYYGVINKFGVDLGATTSSMISPSPSPITRRWRAARAASTRTSSAGCRAERPQ